MQIEKLEPVSPVKPAVAWMGGKNRLAKRLVSKINQTPHSAYAEAFVGMGGVFFRRDLRPPCEIINDYSGDVANFFRILQNHFLPFVDLIRWLVSSRTEWDRLKQMRPETLTDLQRAVRFLYVQKLAFGGKIIGQNFAMEYTRSARFDVTRIVPMLADIHDRLSGVTIERKHYADFLVDYDRKGMLFYLDPPYYGCEHIYGEAMFHPDDFEQLADLLKNIESKFILSINDHPDIRAIFKGFDFETVEVDYGLGKATETRKRFGELIITN